MRRIALGAAGVAIVGLALALTFTLDQRAHAGRVARNVTIHGQAIGGMDVRSLRDVVEQVAAAAKETQLVIRAVGGEGGARSMRLDASEIALEVDPTRTVAAALRAGRQANLLTRLLSWALSPVRPRDSGVAVSADHDAVYRLVGERDSGREPPEEPTIRGEAEGVEVVPGRPGRGVDAADVIDALPNAARRGFPLTVAVQRGEVAPRHTLSQARDAAARAELLTEEEIEVSAGGESRTLSVGDLREWLFTLSAGGELVLDFHDARALETLREEFDGIGKDPVDARFVVDAGLKLLAGRDGTRCCSAEAVTLLEERVLRRSPGTPAPERVGPLPMAAVPPERGVEEARELRITEMVGAFTTEHKAGEPRVRNIHRIADLMRGKIIEPGGTLSVNGEIGRRTVENGFVSAPEIQDGNFSEGVGGGISQFATTLFNAAFFAGLEFPEYQSHSIYISRYPYGREATLSFPKPDLKIRNPTPYGVLVWTSYTDTSISVSLWSTKHYKSEQTGQTQSPRGPCTFVRTERTRTAPDGSKTIDRVNALYRPEEGVQC